MGNVVNLFTGKPVGKPDSSCEDDGKVEVLEPLEELLAEARRVIAVLKWWLQQPVVGPVSRTMYHDQWARCAAMGHGQFIRFVAAIGEVGHEEFQTRAGYYWAIVSAFGQRVSGPAVQARPPRRIPRTNLRLVREEEPDGA